MRQLFLCLFPFLPLSVLASPPGALPALSFNRDVRPILSENCYQCHGPDAADRKANRRLDTFEGATAELKAIRAIVPGDPAASDAWIRITSEYEDELMPPADSHKTLSPGQKETLRRWIAEGAIYEPHWAFIPLPELVPVPAVTGKPAAWPRGEIDRFVLARLKAEKLTPAREASRDRWLRRVTFDLTGLPPTQPELDAFLADRRPDAYSRVVDRLLASPRFGERMALPWLDLARYADSYGYQADIETFAWPYRDWVVSALNANLHWDEFITWQIAGDLMPSATPEQRLATAFNRLHRKTNEGGSVPEEFRQDGISDRVHTFGTAFLGLTLECARCHDHKYDPVSTRDYYALGAFFNSIDEFGLLQDGGGGGKARIVGYPAMHLPTPEQASTLAEQRTAVDKQERLLREWPAAREKEFRDWLSVAAVIPPVPVDLAAHYPLNAEAEGKFLNRVDAVDEAPVARGAGNTTVAGPSGEAVLCSGDDPLKLPDFGLRHAHDPMSFSFWLRPGEAYPRAVVFSNGASSDTTYNGYELLLEAGQLRWSVIREYPGNCISVRAMEEIPVGEWTHVVATYDGSSRAGGLKLYLNGQLAPAVVVRDGLTRDYAVGKALEFGARNRDNGLRNGGLDEIHVFTRAITAIEVADLHASGTLAAVLAKPVQTADELAQLSDYYFSAHDVTTRAVLAQLHAARTDLLATIEGVKEVSVMEEAPEPRAAFVLARGAYDAPAERVDRTPPHALPPLPADAPRDRLGLARWLTEPGHPLTARVIVNRLWQEFFGGGLVATVDNFGLQGSPPSHPELLDWLARDFIAHGWDYQRACREIVLSATYRQDSRVTPALRERDPDNILLARGPARRLTAEMLRDSALALGGLLVPELGGPPVKPYQPEGSMWKALNNFLPEYQPDTAAGLYRRSLYTFWRRTTTPPNMMALDAPTRDVCTVRRQSTNTPLQPLVLLNDPQFVEAARALGARMLREGGTTPKRRLAWVFREVTGREPTRVERPLLRKLYDEQTRIFAADPDSARKLIAVGALPADATLPPVELAAATTVAASLFNLDASLMLR